VLRGEVPLLLRKLSETKRSQKRRGERTSRGKEKAPPVPLDHVGSERFNALKEWRAAVAKEHNLPAFVVFHDSTLAEMARAKPDSLDALSKINGVGARKLEAYGPQILRVLS
jgi:ATP-dependent DNA helicase RecQ